ncbi:hypothetical protein IQ62_35990 [Streptomyces scabiei]|uniref:hypothetical protein n=1 Tax=Streptomyces scabiei TaxID=1930 RepID=UPI0004E7740D|nr:hypothetical protein [Streptomyces scabiei]KFF96599.1 hypothetical protein IQ62_35990 [Streptomyces scabiei]
MRDAHLVVIRSGECVLDTRLAVQQILLAERQGRLAPPAQGPRQPPPPPPTPPTRAEAPTRVLNRPDRNVRH